MTTFDDFGPLPSVPFDATPAKQQAWRLVRELHAQDRLSTVEAMMIVTALWEAPASTITSEPAASLHPQAG